MKTSPTSFESVQDIVVEFHKLAHEFKKPEYLEIAGILGKVKETHYQTIAETVDKYPHPLPEVVR